MTLSIAHVFYVMLPSFFYPDRSSPILGSIVVSIPACHAGDRGSIPRRGGLKYF